MHNPLSYSVRVSAFDSCDVRRTYEAVWELGEVPTTWEGARDAARRLRAMLASDGYTEEVKTSIDTYFTLAISGVTE